MLHEDLLGAAGPGCGPGAVSDIASDRTEFPGIDLFTRQFDNRQPGQKLRVCIAVEDIVGPIRNGGIGTTYTHLSRLLAQAGHSVVIAYLRGAYCQNHSIDYWIRWYKDFGVTFVPVDPDRVRLEGAAPRWIRPMYALYRYLKSEPFDLVHVSEWRGSAFLSLLAKKQGLAFGKTVFCVKASSPWLWNREHGYQTIDRMDDVLKVFAERRSIELADRVISGSRYLLGWMQAHGYQLPEGRAHVQPNVVVPINLDSLAEKRRKMAGSRMAVSEIVFFGRLEARKGLDIFFDAVDRLVAKGVALPPITLMGKYGAKIPDYPELSIDEYIRERSRGWPMKTKVLDNFGNEEALRYLLGDDRLAVMPSRIENSTLAVYETVYYGIPFIASDVGGTAELVDSRHHEQVLTAPHPVSLARKLGEAISQGGFVAAPSFDNAENLRQWLAFHDAMGAYVQTLEENRSQEQDAARLLVSICLVAGDDVDYVKDVLSRLKNCADDQRCEVVVTTTGKTPPVLRTWLEELKKELGRGLVITAWDGAGEQGAQNHAAACATGELLVFVDTGGILGLDYVRTLQEAAKSSSAEIFGCFYRNAWQIEEMVQGKGKPYAVIMEDLTSAFFSPDEISPVVTFRKNTFQQLGGFQEDYKIPGALRELVSKAIIQNVEVETIPEILVWRVESYASRKRIHQGAVFYRAIRPLIESVPWTHRLILMSASSYAPEQPKLSKEGGVGAIRDPINFLEKYARSAANEASRSPKLRNLGWKIYYLNIRLFRKAILMEIRMFKLLIRLKDFFWRR